MDGEGSALRREVQDQNQDWKTARAANFPKWDITCFFASVATWSPFKVDEYTPIKISQTKEAGKYLYKVNIGGEEVGAQSDIFFHTEELATTYENITQQLKVNINISPVKRCIYPALDLRWSTWRIESLANLKRFDPIP